MPILKPEVYMKEKRFLSTGAGKDPSVRAGPNTYSVDEGDTDKIIRINRAEQEALYQRQAKLMTQQFCQQLCCAGLVGGGLALAGAGGR